MNHTTTQKAGLAIGKPRFFYKTRSLAFCCIKHLIVHRFYFIVHVQHLRLPFSRHHFW